MSKPMQLSWWRFGYLMLLLAIGPVLVTLFTRSLNAGAAMIWLLYASMIIFFAFGWRSLRRENAVRQLFDTDIDRARSVLSRRSHLSKSRFSGFWLAVTPAIILALIIGSALYKSAA